MVRFLVSEVTLYRSRGLDAVRAQVARLCADESSERREAGGPARKWAAKALSKVESGSTDFAKLWSTFPSGGSGFARPRPSDDAPSVGDPRTDAEKLALSD